MAKVTRRVGPNGRVVIPKHIRDELGIHAGDEILFHVEGARGWFQATDSDRWLKEFTEALPKTKLPKGTDGSVIYYEQVEERMRRAGIL